MDSIPKYSIPSACNNTKLVKPLASLKALVSPNNLTVDNVNKGLDYEEKKGTTSTISPLALAINCFRHTNPSVIQQLIDMGANKEELDVTDAIDEIPGYTLPEKTIGSDNIVDGIKTNGGKKKSSKRKTNRRKGGKSSRRKTRKSRGPK